MLHAHQRSVNVNRLKLLDALRTNLAKHREEYAAAVAAYQERLLADLQLAVKKVKKVKDVTALKDFEFEISYPEDHSADYEDVITMFEHSVDENINLDGNSFRAFIENKWSWVGNHRELMSTYSVAGSSIKNLR
jgi:hypothetical protein